MCYAIFKFSEEWSCDHFQSTSPFTIISRARKINCKELEFQPTQLTKSGYSSCLHLLSFLFSSIIISMKRILVAKKRWTKIEEEKIFRGEEELRKYRKELAMSTSYITEKREIYMYEKYCASSQYLAIFSSFSLLFVLSNDVVYVCICIIERCSKKFSLQFL